MIFTASLRSLVLRPTHLFKLLSPRRVVLNENARINGHKKFSVSSVRFISRDGEVSKSVELALKTADRIPNDYHIIYRAPMHIHVKVTYAVTILALMAAPVVSAIAFYNQDEDSFPLKLPGYDDIYIFETPMESYFVLGFLLLTVFNVMVLIGKYPYRVYCNPLENKYIGVFQHKIPLLRKRIEFKSGDVTKSDAFLWKNEAYKIKNKKVMFLTEYFHRPIDIERMMVNPDETSAAEVQKEAVTYVVNLMSSFCECTSGRLHCSSFYRHQAVLYYEQ